MTTEIRFKRLDEILFRHFANAKTCVVIVAPFITLRAFNSIIEDIDPEVTLKVVTRWISEELASGVSDCRIYESLSTNDKAELYLLDSLHAKYYRSDDEILIGSANITRRALRDGGESNFEILGSLRLSRSEVSEFERGLLQDACLVTDEIYAEWLEVQNQQREDSPDKVDLFEFQECDFSTLGDYWLPSIQDPRSLYSEYLELFNRRAGRDNRWSSELVRWRLPMGLKQDEFQAIVASRLLHEPTVMLLNEYLAARERRFGEVARYLAEKLDLDSQGSDAWSTLLDWLLYFRSDDYSHRRNPHSELVQYLGT